MKRRFERRAWSRSQERHRIAWKRRRDDARVWWRLAWQTENPIQYLVDHGELPADAFVAMSFVTRNIELPISWEDLGMLLGDVQEVDYGE